jgi:hypothetical protein
MILFPKRYKHPRLLRPRRTQSLAKSVILLALGLCACGSYVDESAQRRGSAPAHPSKSAVENSSRAFASEFVGCLIVGFRCDILKLASPDSQGYGWLDYWFKISEPRDAASPKLYSPESVTRMRPLSGAYLIGEPAVEDANFKIHMCFSLDQGFMDLAVFIDQESGMITRIEQLPPQEGDTADLLCAGQGDMPNNLVDFSFDSSRCIGLVDSEKCLVVLKYLENL